MNRTLIIALAGLLAGWAGLAQAQDTGIDEELNLDYYLPDDVTYDPDITTPKEYLGFEVGQWHIHHADRVGYLRHLAEESDRVEIREYARSHQKRPLVLLTISSPGNMNDIEDIRERHVQLTDPETSHELTIEEMPVVTWLGYSVHGDEASGGQAALLSAYYLAAGEGERVEELLEESVVLLDPAYNPDGLERFATWVNDNRSYTMDGDGNNREHNQPWPGGRTNHYWFDLNRDWMPVQHPESRGRVQMYQKWRPNVLTDHHEMGTGATYFFQPGIPSRNNPNIPQGTVDLTDLLADYHAEYLDERAELYYTEERFDDFFVGKGSTYPDVQGTIGILFEQASARGHLQDSQHGPVSFPYAILNQFTTSLSTLYGTLENRETFLEFKRDFHVESVQEARQNDLGGYLFSSPKDPARTWHLLDILDIHDIEVHRLDREITVDGEHYEPESSYIVPADQPRYRLMNSMFEQRTTFQDSIFYDVSTWSLPLSFGMQNAELRGGEYSENLLGERIDEPRFPEGELHGGRAEHSYVFEWHGYYAPRAVYRLLDEDVRVKVGTRPFTTGTSEGSREFDYGTILVNLGIQDQVSEERIHEIVQKIADKDAIDVYAIDQGRVEDGISLGSPAFNTVEKPRTMILTGSGVSSYDSGQVWHLLDQRFKMHHTLVDSDRLNYMDLDEYNTIVMSSGSYHQVSDSGVENLIEWVSDGGTLITTKGATAWADRHDLVDVEFKESPDLFASEEMWPYDEQSNKRGAQVIGGTIFETEVDLTHPLLYGYQSETLPVFRSTNRMMAKHEQPWASPVRYTENPLMSGYISEPQLERIGGLPAVSVGSYGSGRVILMSDNPNFRAFWFGTNKLFMNSIYFGGMISGGATL